VAGRLVVLVIISIEQVWNLALPPAVGLSATVGAALMLLLGFGLLVLERQLAQETRRNGRKPVRWHN
jgi:hypothetical protein